MARQQVDNPTQIDLERRTHFIHLRPPSQPYPCNLVYVRQGNDSPGDESEEGGRIPAHVEDTKNVHGSAFLVQGIPHVIRKNAGRPMPPVLRDLSGKVGTLTDSCLTSFHRTKKACYLLGRFLMVIVSSITDVSARFGFRDQCPPWHQNGPYSATSSFLRSSQGMPSSGCAK